MSFIHRPGIGITSDSCCPVYPIYSEQLISLDCWPLSPLYNTLLWAAPGGYLFLHIIALSCLHTTLRTNYPCPARGRDSYLPLQSFKTNYLVTGEKINNKKGKNKTKTYLFTVESIELFPLDLNIYSIGIVTTNLLESILSQNLKRVSAPIWRERIWSITWASAPFANGDDAEDIISRGPAVVLSFPRTFAQIYQDVSEKKTLCGNRFGEQHRWRC